MRPIKSVYDERRKARRRPLDADNYLPTDEETLQIMFRELEEKYKQLLDTKTHVLERKRQAIKALQEAKGSPNHQQLQQLRRSRASAVYASSVHDLQSAF